MPLRRILRCTAVVLATLTVLLIQPAPAGDAPLRPLPGQIVIDPEYPHWLKREGGAHVFICGPGDPEDFLYRGTRRPDGTRDGDQVQLIRKLIEHGGNSIYMQTVRSHGGDAKQDRTQNPFVDSDARKGVDPRILDQWEQWFALMDQHGILIYLYFYDDGAKVWNTGDEVGADERAFLETIVRRFKHHKNLIWIVGEESEEAYSTVRVQAIARVIRAADDHGHIIGNHHLSGTTFKTWRPDGALSHYSMQFNATGERVHAGALEARAKAEGRYQVIYSENTQAPTDIDGMRRHAWTVAMAGVMPMLLRMDIADTPVEALQQCRILQRFFESTDFYTMSPHDELRHGAAKYVLADAGRSYIAYADEAGGALGLKSLPAGACAITWLDCVTGRMATENHMLREPGDREFKRPAAFGAECAAWIRFPDVPRRPAIARATPPLATRPVESSPRARSGNAAPVVQDQRFTVRSGEPLYVQLHFEDADGPGPYVYTVVSDPTNGKLSGEDNDRTYTSRRGFVGTDKFRWKVSDGHAESRVGTVTIEVTERLSGAPARGAAGNYFPPPDSAGGWRRLEDRAQIARQTGIDREKLDAVFDYIQGTSKHGALLVARNGWLVYERYFGRGHREATPNGASVGKSFTSVAVGILMYERPELFPDGLDQRVFTEKHMPPVVFPLTDPRKADIKLGQLLSMTAGIRGNNPGMVRGQPVTLMPAGPDGWQACVDEMAAGKKEGPLHTQTLWCAPGEGYSYATSSIHLASMMLRHVTGRELQDYVAEKLAQPLGWDRWGWGYKNSVLKHTPGGGGIALRPADMLRFAYLLLRDGRWEGRQVIPADYIRTCRGPSGYNPHSNYSLQFNVNAAGEAAGVPRDAFWKTGSGGHCIYIVPSLDLVVYKMGGRDEQYSPANTGVPAVPESMFKYDGSRDNWRAMATGDDVYAETLRRVLAAIGERQ